MSKKYFLIGLVVMITLSSCADDFEYVPVVSNKIAIGKLIFFDKNLSKPIGQACASCHAPETGFSDPLLRDVSEGAITGAFANRNSPNLAYNVFSPERTYNTTDETYIGGLFLDGRSPNLQEQLRHPFINPVEMNNADIADVISKIKKTSYYSEIEKEYGVAKTDEELMSYIADALASFETSKEVNSFTSKFDYFNKQLIKFTDDEKKGLSVFKGKGKCAQCHVLEPDERTGKILFTDFSYDNIGVPRNEKNPFYNQSTAVNPAGANFIDLGIGAIVSQPEHNGKFRVPTLRNITISAPYFHNGSFKTLKEVIHFYNVRDVNPNEFATPEVLENVNRDELGNLKMTAQEESQLETFLGTLTDHYRK
ncbi:cytochrome-c peroxidase [Flavobacterium sp. LB2P53]|uniref:cytochrome-c peroxidase n=1 Tax=Flavobacterium sp. LB2P53 TaxID=2497481 RepID=UPI000F838832|nr:cytochrome c peroxidase [Flavobacterium sp. LB2P53]RTY67098.1 cytochrome B6 [Flavobacterium sp. LB2P53]